MFIMRGVPGSGKSTLAKRIQKQYPEAVKCSADDFFIDADGIYRWVFLVKVKRCIDTINSNVIGS